MGLYSCFTFLRGLDFAAPLASSSPSALRLSFPAAVPANSCPVLLNCASLESLGVYLMYVAHTTLVVELKVWMSANRVCQTRRIKQ